jgi:hypothetical protein
MAKVDRASKDISSRKIGLRSLPRPQIIWTLAGVLLAILGSVMTNGFAAEFLSQIPGLIKAIVPAEKLVSPVQNPQALINAQTQSQLQSLFGQAGAQGTALLQRAVQVLRESLSYAISEVFIIGFIIIGLAVLAHIFLKEIPLHQHNSSVES